MKTSRVFSSILAAVLGIGIFGVQPATAQSTETLARYRSPQSAAIELKLGPYTPNIDGSIPGGTPFADIVGDSPGLMLQAEVDYQIWHGFGSIGVGFSFGYYNNGASPLQDNGGPGKPTTSTVRVAGETALTLIPLSVLAVYRFDVLAKRLAIPFVPYAKLGFNYTFWSITKGDGGLADYNGEKAEGGSWGLQFNAGIALLLDVFEPQSAKRLDTDLGVNHTYVFVELHYVGADRFGAASALDVGDTTILGGLAFEM